MSVSELEEQLLGQIRLAGLPEPEREYRFSRGRLFRLDFAYPDLKLGIEVDGGTWSHGRHSRGAGYRQDCIKQNLAMLEGWRLLRFTGDLIESGEALATIERALQGEDG